MVNADLVLKVLALKELKSGASGGMKVGTASTELIGFYGATPVDRPSFIADPSGGATVDAESRTAINAILDLLIELGLMASS